MKEVVSRVGPWKLPWKQIITRLINQIRFPRLLVVKGYMSGVGISRRASRLGQAALFAGLAGLLIFMYLRPVEASLGTIENYSAVGVAEQTQTGTSNNWVTVTGTANTGTTTSTGGWVDSANLAVGEDYLVMVWGEHSTNSTSGRSGMRVTHGGTAFTESQAIEETDQTGAAFKTPYFWFTVWTAVTGEDLEVQFFNATSTNTAAVEDVSLVVMNVEDLVANNELIYNISTTGGTLDTTFTPKATITWTPTNANDTWWLGGYVQHDTVDIDTDQHEARFDINSGTIRSTYSIEGEDAADTPLYGLGWVEQFAASSQTVELEIRESAANEEWDSAGLFALRLDGFETFKAYAQTGDGTPLTANSVYVEQGNVDQQMLSQGNFLAAAGAIVDDNGGVVNSKLTLADVDITDPTGGYQHNTADTVPTTLADMQINASLGLKDIDFDAQRTAAVQAELQDRWVVAFSMERAGPPAKLTMDGYIFENDDGTVTGNTLGGGGGDFPSVLGVPQETISTTMVTDHAVGLGATINAGDLLLMIFVASASLTDDEATTITDPAGFTEKRDRQYSVGTDVRQHTWIGVKKAIGNEDGTTVNVVTSVSTSFVAQVYRIDAATWSGNIADIVVSTHAEAETTNPDPPSVSAAASGDNLFIAVSTYEDSDFFATAAPTNYTNLDTVISDGPDKDATLSTARRELAAISDDPGTFTVELTPADKWQAFTIVIPPASAGNDDPGEVTGGTQTAGSEFSSGQIPTGVRVGERMNLRVHLTNSGGTLQDTNELALFYDRGDGIWSKVKSQQPPMTAAGSGCDSTAWTCEALASAGDVGRYASLAIDQLSHPWVSYRDETTAELKIARYVGSNGAGCALNTWSCQVVDSDTDVGKHTSITVGRGTDAWISYWDDTADDLRVANFVGTGGNCDDLYGGADAWNCTIVDSTGIVGEYNSIALDRFGYPWVSYFDATNTTLKVAQYVGSGGSGCASSAWTCTTVENTGVEGQWSSLAFDEEGKAWVSYYHSSSTELKVARFVQGGGSGCSSTAWTCVVVDSDNISGEYSSIGFNPNGTAFVSYWNATANNLRVANYVGSGGNCDTAFLGSDAWQCTEVDSTNNVGQSTSIAFSPGGDPWISYRDSTNNTLRLARFVGAGGSGCADTAWTCQAIESVAGANNAPTSLAFDADGLPWISHFDETSDDLLITYLNTQAGEILISRSQNVINGSSLTASRADMTSVSDTLNRDSADCVAIGTWNDGRYFEAEGGSGLTLPNGLGTDQCTEVMWTIDTTQATPGTTYRFIVATADNFRPDHGRWRGPIAINEYPTLTTRDATESVYRYSQDNLPEFSNCNTDTNWGCASIDNTDGGGHYTSSGFDQDGRPWVSYYEATNDDLKVARYVGSGGTGCSNSAWHCTVIDSTGDVGQYTSLAFDHSGAAWISYYDVTNADLKVARYVGFGGTGCATPVWSCSTVDSGGSTGQYSSIGFDASGKAWVSYYDATNDDLDVARYIGVAGTGCVNTAWTCTTIESANDVGRLTSIAFDATGTPWVSYYDTTNGDLKVARYTGLGNTNTCELGVGAVPVVESQSTNHTDTGGTTLNVTKPTGVANGDLLIAHAGIDTASITLPSGFTQVYQITAGNHVSAFGYKVVTDAGSEPASYQFSFSVPERGAGGIVRISGADTSSPINISGTATAIDTDPIVAPSVTTTVDNTLLLLALGSDIGGATITPPSGFTLVYEADNPNASESDSFVWEGSQASAGVTGTKTFGTLGFTPTWGIGTIAIAPASTGGNWDCETVDATDDVGSYSSLAFDASGDAWISYYDNTGGNLEVAEYVGSAGDCDTVGGGSDAWECTTVDSTDNVGRFTSIAFDATGAAWISYLDFTNTDLNAARFVGSGGDCNSSAWDCMDISSSAAGGNGPTAMAFDASGVPWISHMSTLTNSLNLSHLHLPPNPLSADILIPYATRSAGSGDLRYRLTAGVSPYGDPYGVCNGTSQLTGYCGLYHPDGHLDSMTAVVNERPIYAFSTRYDNDDTVPAARVYFRTDISPATNNVVLQAYRGGSTNAWETVSTYSSAGCASANCVIAFEPTGTTTDYFEADGSYFWMHYRLYQVQSASAGITLSLDSFTAPQTESQLRHGRVFREQITDPLRW